MRVAIDTNALYTTQAGVARYVRGLLSGFPRVAPDLAVTEVAWPVENFHYRQPQRALKTFVREFLWSRTAGPRRVAEAGAEVFHSTCILFVDPPSTTRHVVTLHDLAALRHPERFRAWQRRRSLREVRKLARMDRVICVSQFTADEAMKLLGLSASKLEVVHNGCDWVGEAMVLPREPVEILPDEYFLFVGSLEPGKNLSLLREVYESARASGKSLPPLMIVGARWEGVANEGAPPPDWHYLGRLPDEELAWLYQRALALVFPSRYEGFGLPIAEAMALGCPVLCSKVASLPEVGGEAALYCELNRDGYRQAMMRLAGDSTLREELAAAGSSHVRKFTWDRCACETREVYLGLKN